MNRSKPLTLYEEIMLLVLRDERGTVVAGFPEHLVAELNRDIHIALDFLQSPKSICPTDT